jgi:hypothetical protein
LIKKEREKERKKNALTEQKATKETGSIGRECK